MCLGSNSHPFSSQVYDGYSLSDVSDVMFHTSANADVRLRTFVEADLNYPKTKGTCHLGTFGNIVSKFHDFHSRSMLVRMLREYGRGAHHYYSCS